jgi:hypothetical protein
VYQIIIPKDVDGRGSRMAEAVMPEVGGDGEVGVGCWRGGRHGVEIASTIAAKHHATGLHILHRKAQSVKFDRAIVIPSELTNRKQVTHKGWNN